MERITQNKIMVLISSRADEEMIKKLSRSGNFHFEIVSSTNECLIKLQTCKYDALIVDSSHLLLGDKVNAYYLRTISELAPVIVISDNEKPEIENEIRAERIYYFLVKPICEEELLSTLIQGAKWKEKEKRTAAADPGRMFISKVSRIMKIAMMFVLFSVNCCLAGGITVSVSSFRNLTGNACNDWIGDGFASNILTSVKSVAGVRVIEEAEMGKLLEAIKFDLSGFVDEKTVVEKGKVIGTGYSVVGSIQLFDEKAVVCYRLVNMETGEIVFGNTLEGRLKNILGLEDTVSRDIVKHFEARFPSVCANYAPKKKSSFAVLHGDGSEGLKCSLMSDLAEAAKRYEAAINDNPEFADGYLGLGEIYMQKKEYPQALSRFCRAFELYRKYSDSYFAGCACYRIGEAYYQQSDYDSAVSYFNQALAYKKNSKRDFQVLYVYERLSEIAEMRNENVRVVEYLNRSLKTSERLGDVASQIESLVRLARFYEERSDLKTSDEGRELLAPGRAKFNRFKSFLKTAWAYSSQACELSKNIDYRDKDKLVELNDRLQKRLSGAFQQES